MIKFSDVSKKFPDGTIALAEINLEIPTGEFIFLVGPSGCGKTTFLKLLIRDFLPTSGEILIDDKNLTKIKSQGIVALRRSCGFVFQDLKLLSARTVFENVALSLEVMDKKLSEIQDEVSFALKSVNLENYANMFPAQLSGGELQRVAIARAIVGHPQYLFADEPTGNVDPDNIWSIMKILDEINQSGTTLIVATHDAEVVDSLKKRVVRLDKGKIISDKKGKYK